MPLLIIFQILRIISLYFLVLIRIIFTFYEIFLFLNHLKSFLKLSAFVIIDFAATLLYNFTFLFHIILNLKISISFFIIILVMQQFIFVILLFLLFLINFLLFILLFNLLWRKLELLLLWRRIEINENIYTIFQFLQILS